jgi:hypothetical protein
MGSHTHTISNAGGHKPNEQCGARCLGGGGGKHGREQESGQPDAAPPPTGCQQGGGVAFYGMKGISRARRSPKKTHCRPEPDLQSNADCAHSAGSRAPVAALVLHVLPRECGEAAMPLRRLRTHRRRKEEGEKRGPKLAWRKKKTQSAQRALTRRAFAGLT